MRVNLAAAVIAVQVVSLMLSACQPLPVVSGEDQTMLTVTVDDATTTPTSGKVDLNCGDETEKTFEDWRTWTKVNPVPLLSEGHPHENSPSYVDIYVDDLAKDTYLAASAPYPECARIVKAKYADKSAAEVLGLTVMVKMPAEYDLSATGTWWYAAYDAGGTEASKHGRLWLDCAYCHQQAEETEYLFSREVMAAIGE